MFTFCMMKLYFAIWYMIVVSGCDQSPTDSAENYAQLDSLCLSVTEHALGSLGKYSLFSAENYAQLDSLCLSVTEHALGSLGKFSP